MGGGVGGGGPQPVSHSSVGGGLVFQAAVVVTRQLHFVRIEPSIGGGSAP